MVGDAEFEDLAPETQQAIAEELGCSLHVLREVLPVFAKYGLTLSDCAHLEPHELPQEVIAAICKIKPQRH